MYCVLEASARSFEFLGHDDCVTGKKVVEGVEAEYAAAIDAIPNGLAKTRGLAVGRAAAAAILRARKADGSDTLLFDKAYPQGTRPGEYRFTPGSDFAFAPGWSDVTPFVLNSSSQFRPGPPYAVTSKQYAKAKQEFTKALEENPDLEGAKEGLQVLATTNAAR